MPDLFRSKLESYIAQNVVNQSILLIDFDHEVSLKLLKVKRFKSGHLKSNIFTNFMRCKR